MPLHPATLTCLQVFNAVVEERSFSKASSKLGLTQSAISHRVKQLEDITGVVLINRTTRKIQITELGNRLYNQSRLNLAEIQRSLDSLVDTSNSPLSLTTISSLATKWLLPKLNDYNQRYPEQPLSVLTDDKIVDLRFEGIDAAIRLTNVKDTSISMTFICDEWVFPVANKSLIKSQTIFEQPHKLYEFPWLLDIVSEKGNDESSWKGWLQSHGLSFPAGRADQSFNRTDIALQASAAGQGVAIARASLVESDMLDMNLYHQVGRAIKMKYSYYFVCPHDKANTPLFINLRNWITQELQRTVDRVKEQLIFEQ